MGKHHNSRTVPHSLLASETGQECPFSLPEHDGSLRHLVESCFERSQGSEGVPPSSIQMPRKGQI